MKENQEEPRDKAKKITKPDPKTKEKKRGRKNIKEQKSKKKQKWSNGEFDNKNENRRIARDTWQRRARKKRNWKEETSRIAAIRESVQEQEFRDGGRNPDGSGIEDTR